MRDRGEIVFEGGGRYRKLRPAAPRSLAVDFAAAAHYVSARQVARVAIEAWAATNVDCWRCRAPLLLVPPNTHLLDAVCSRLGHEVQVKAVAGISGDQLTGAAFSPLARRVGEAPRPGLFDRLVSYDRLRSIVVLAEFVDGRSLVLERLHERTPLGPTARRAGWVGATLDLSSLERHVVVGPSFEPEVALWP